MSQSLFDLVLVCQNSSATANRRRPSNNAEEQRQSPIDPQQQGVVGFSNRAADFIGRNDSNLIDGYLRRLPQTIAGRRIDIDSELVCIRSKRRRQRANDNRG